MSGKSQASVVGGWGLGMTCNHISTFGKTRSLADLSLRQEQSGLKTQTAAAKLAQSETAHFRETIKRPSAGFPVTNTAIPRTQEQENDESSERRGVEIMTTSPAALLSASTLPQETLGINDLVRRSEVGGGRREPGSP